MTYRLATNNIDTRLEVEIEYYYPQKDCIVALSIIEISTLRRKEAMNLCYFSDNCGWLLLFLVRLTFLAN